MGESAKETFEEVAAGYSKAWPIDSPATTVFDFDYTGGRDQLLRLYDKGTRRQWIGKDRLDWSLEVDFENPLGFPDEIHPLFGTTWWDKMNDAEKGEARRHVEAWRFSQFMHGEQGALICTAKIVQTVPDIDSKYYAATQVIDEAPPRRGLLALPLRQAAARLPAQRQPEEPARRCHLRLALGHDLPRHAGARRGSGTGRLRLHP